MKKFLILFRHGFGFQKAQLIFWAQTQPVVLEMGIDQEINIEFSSIFLLLKLKNSERIYILSQKLQ